MKGLAPYLKAVGGGLVAGLTSLATALTDNHISGQEWVYALLATVIGTGVVYGIPNKTGGASGGPKP